MMQINKAELQLEDGRLITTFSGTSRFDGDRDREEVYGNVENVLAVMQAVDAKGRGLFLVFNDGDSTRRSELVIRDASLKSRLIWAHELQQ